MAHQTEYYLGPRPESVLGVNRDGGEGVLVLSIFALDPFLTLPALHLWKSNDSAGYFRDPLLAAFWQDLANERSGGQLEGWKKGEAGSPSSFGGISSFGSVPPAPTLFAASFKVTGPWVWVTPHFLHLYSLQVVTASCN